ncbi:BPL-N domain-containing protein [Rhodococcus qingshengii]|uniref:BPL-N domain-containing protein n=1 Tax=Rhodococcus qingshengii TaxID=334542 RepID=UPI0037C9986C
MRNRVVGGLASAWVHMEQHAPLIREWVHAGGRYLGFCLGGYLAGATPGFGLLPGDSARYISSRNSEIDTTGNTVVEVTWRGDKRWSFSRMGRFSSFAAMPRRRFWRAIAMVGSRRWLPTSAAGGLVSSVRTPKLTSFGTQAVSPILTVSDSTSVWT